MASRKLELSILALILGLSLFLRLHTPDAFLTPDERNWTDRSCKFRDALIAGRYAETYTSPHPGVVTMWVGTTVMALEPGHDWDSDNVLLIFRGRRMIALLSGLAMVPIWLLARRLWGPWASLMGIALVALDPFLLAHSRLLHLDALTSLGMTLSVLGLALYAAEKGRAWALLLSGATAGLAVLNKSSALFMIPFAALALSYVTWRRQGLSRAGARALVQDVALWGVALAGTCWLLWPALWTSPVETLGQVLRGALSYAATPHENGNFFWGRPRLDPGPAFYPVALLFRLSPIVLLGLGGYFYTWRHRGRRAAEGLLWGLCLAFAAFMTLGAKKFDRYLLPVFPPLDLLAGLGLVTAGQQLLQRIPSLGRGRPWLRWGGMALLPLLQLAIVLPQAPYYLSYYNPLLGGGREASQRVLVGWGEGLDQVAAWLNQQPEAEHLTMATVSYHAMLVGNFFRGQTDEFSWMDWTTDYVVFYINLLQRDPEGPSNTAGPVPPAATITVKGIEYARIYPTSEYLRPLAEFLEEHAQEDDLIVLGDYAPFLTPQLSLPSIWLPPDLTVVEAGARLREAAAGHGRVWYLYGRGSDAVHLNSTLYQLATRGLKLSDMIATPPARVVAYELPAGASFGVTAIQHPIAVRFEDVLEIVGYGQLSPSVDQAQAIDLALQWRPLRQLEGDYSLALRLVDAQGEVWGSCDEWLFNAAREPAVAWSPQDAQLTYHALPLLFGTPPGEYTIELTLYQPSEGGSAIGLVAHSEDVPVQGLVAQLGPVYVHPTTVLDEGALPEGPWWEVHCPAGQAVGEAVDFLGSGCLPEQAMLGPSLPLTLFWQVRQGHLPDYDLWLALQPVAGGKMQAYRMPPTGTAYPSSAWRAGEYLRSQVRVPLPVTLPIGTYRVLMDLVPANAEGSRASQPVTLGTIAVESRAHVFEQPRIAHPQLTQLGEGIVFLGYDLPKAQATPGDVLPLTLYWQAAGPTGVGYKVFTHLLDAASQVWGQQDNPPQRGQAPTTSWVENEIIVDQYEIPVDEKAPPGAYRIEIGLYDPDDGQRVPVTGPDGQRVPEDRILLDQPVSITW